MQPTIWASAARRLNFALWVAQTLLFMGFVLIAWIKITTPIPALSAMWPWTGQMPESVVRLLGVIDLAGGVGVLVPALTRIKPQLTVVAALGCVTLQICATAFHIWRGEFDGLFVNAIFFAVALFILWGRLRVPVSGFQNRI